MPLSYAACQSFLSTLSLRRATYRVPHYKATPAISIHALLAESDRLCVDTHEPACRFLSTLSLRRATKIDGTASPTQNDFYPRSPCGERPAPAALSPSSALISIHALLAESDTDTIRKTQRPYVISIHALLAESDRRFQLADRRQGISIHALLAESDTEKSPDAAMSLQFLSTLSLRRATRRWLPRKP